MPRTSGGTNELGAGSAGEGVTRGFFTRHPAEQPDEQCHRRAVALERGRRYRFTGEAMKRITLYSVLVVGGFAAFMAAASWSGRRDTVDASNLGARKILYYVDPMHPAYKSDRPGTAPDCGMTLEPVYEEAREGARQPRGAGDESVRVSAERRELVGVRGAH
jgi:hypothetical protein